MTRIPETRIPKWELGEPTGWTVTLTGGATVEIWADGYGKEDGFVVFTSLVDVESEPGDWIVVTGRTPSNPQRLIVAIARFREEDVDVSAIRSM
jgi:hypothetical protein